MPQQLIKETVTVTETIKDNSGNVIEEKTTTTVKEYTYAPSFDQYRQWFNQSGWYQATGGAITSKDISNERV